MSNTVSGKVQVTCNGWHVIHNEWHIMSDTQWVTHNEWHTMSDTQQVTHSEWHTVSGTPSVRIYSPMSDKTAPTPKLSALIILYLFPIDQRMIPSIHRVFGNQPIRQPCADDVMSEMVTSQWSGGHSIPSSMIPANVDTQRCLSACLSVCLSSSVISYPLMFMSCFYFCYTRTHGMLTS